MMYTELVNIKVTPEQKKALVDLAWGMRVSVSEVVRGWIEGEGPECRKKASVEVVERHAKEVAESKSKGIKMPPVTVSESPKAAVESNPKSPFKFTESTCPKHNFVNVGGVSRCMNCGVNL